MSSLNDCRLAPPAALVRSLWLLIAGFIFSHVAAATGRAGEISVVAVHGDVQTTMAGVVTPLYAGAILQLPAAIRTGADGAIELRQGPTTIAAASNTEFEIPESAATEGLIERIVQISGNAFYNVGKRATTKLRVETPHLVAVIKGTQFNVAAQTDSTTIALFEGRLEVRAPDDSDVIDLNAGEIAIRHRGDVSIRVLRMTAASTIDARRGQDAGAPAASAEPTRAGGIDAPVAALRPEDSPRDLVRAVPDPIDASAALSAHIPDAQALSVPAALESPLAGDIADVAAATSIDRGALDLNLDAGAAAVDVAAAINVATTVDLTGGGLGVDVGTAVDVGAAGVAVDAALDLGGGAVASDLQIAADAGPAAADLGVSAGVGAGSVDLSADVGASVAPAVADVGVDASVGAGSVDLAADVGVSGAPVVADVGVDASVGAGSVDLAADVGAGGAPVDVGVGVNASVDLQDPTVSVGADVGGALGVDLGLGDGGIDVDVSAGGSDQSLVDDVEDVLGGLLNRRPRK